MTVKIIISSAIISAVIAAIGGIITTVITQRNARTIAQETANQELQKRERTWEREDVVSSDEEFAAMASAVAKYIHRDSPQHANEAIGMVASVRAKEYGELGKILDALHHSIDARDLHSAEQELTNAITKKRELKHPTVKQGS